MAVILRKRKSGKGTHSLYLDIHIKGQPRSRAALNMFLYARPKDRLQKLHNEETLKMAAEREAVAQLETQAQANGIKYVPPTKISFDTFFQQYIDNYPHKDVRKYKHAFIHFKAYRGNKAFYLNQEFIDGFKSYLSNSAGLTGETPVMYKGRFKKICELAYKKRIIKIDPNEFNWKMKFDRQALRKEILTEEELNTLASTTCGNEDVKRLFMFCCNTGLRFGDAKKLTWGDIKNWKLGIEQGKTGKYVYVDLNKNARAITGKPSKEGDLIFSGIGDTTNGVQGVIKSWYEKAKLTKHITTHCARHTFCTLLMKNKVDYRTIITLMGWSEREGMRQIMRYSHFIDESAKKAVDGLPEMKLS